MASFAYFEGQCRFFRFLCSNISYITYFVVSSALERLLLVTARVRKELQSCTVSAAMDFELFDILLATI